MRIPIRVIANAKSSSFSVRDGVYTIRINAPVVDGKANIAILKYFCKHLKIRKGDISIVHGVLNHNKILEINISEDTWQEFILAKSKP